MVGGLVGGWCWLGRLEEVGAQTLTMSAKVADVVAEEEEERMRRRRRNRRWW